MKINIQWKYLASCLYSILNGLQIPTHVHCKGCIHAQSNCSVLAEFFTLFLKLVSFAKEKCGTLLKNNLFLRDVSQWITCLLWKCLYYFEKWINSRMVATMCFVIISESQLPVFLWIDFFNSASLAVGLSWHHFSYFFWKPCALLNYIV